MHFLAKTGAQPGCEPPAPDARYCATHTVSRRTFLVSGSGLLSGLMLAASFGSLTGCVKPQEPGLNIATNQWLGYELLHLSRDLPSSDAQPPSDRIRLVELLSNTDSMQALAAGQVDGAGLTLDEAISARANGLALKIILVFDYSAGADALLVNDRITQLAELKGKRIGVERNGVGALMLDAALREAGLESHALQVVDLTADQHLTAFRNGDVDGVITFEPIASQIAKAGGKRLFDSRAIPGSIVDVLAVSERALAASPNAVRALLAGYFRALEHLHRQPEDAMRRMAPRLGLTPADMQEGYRGLSLPDLAENTRLLSGDPSPLASTAASLAALMLRQNMLVQAVPLENFIDSSFLPATPAGTPGQT